MLSTFKTLLAGASSRTDDKLRDVYAIELIDQKIRETEAQLHVSKSNLASLIQRHRSEQKLLDMLRHRITALTERAREAIISDRQDLANEAAKAIAEMENEAVIRQSTVDRLDTQAARLRTSVERGHRKVIDLKQGALQARAIHRGQVMQSQLHSTAQGSSAADEAQSLIDRVIGKDDPFEQAQILTDINAGLDGTNLEERMADAGFGPATKVTARDVLERLKK